MSAGSAGLPRYGLGECVRRVASECLCVLGGFGPKMSMQKMIVECPGPVVYSNRMRMYST